MDYNPYTIDKDHYQKLYAEKLGEIQALDNQIETYEQTNINALMQEMIDTCEQLPKVDADIKLKAALLENYRCHLRVAEFATIRSSFPNPFAKFTKRARLLKEAHNFKKAQIKGVEDELLSLNRRKTKLLNSINALKSRIDHYKQFDINEAKRRQHDYLEQIKSIKRKQKIVNRDWDKADVVIAPFVSKIKETEAEKSKLDDLLREADSFNRQLDNADSRRERAIIHEECERAIGDSSPKRFISSHKGMSDALERDIDKLKKRVRQMASNLTKTFDTIIVDGNNLCYESSGFIGLAPIHALLSAIDSVHTVLIVFDANIRSQLRIDNSSLQNLIGNKANTHVVANKQKADETIIELASRSRDSYILSNDRFVDYFDKEPVEQNRLIRHEIFDGSLIVHDLGIHQRY